MVQSTDVPETCSEVPVGILSILCAGSYMAKNKCFRPDESLGWETLLPDICTDGGLELL